MKRYRLTALLIGVSLLLAGGCTSPSGGLEDTLWILESYGEAGNTRAALSGTRITATFDSTEGQVSGSAGCNQYFGKYQAGERILSISEIGSTEMCCFAPEGIMEQEGEYLQMLNAAESYRIENQRLHIDCGGPVLIFTAGEA